MLRALGMKVREINPRDLRNLDRLIAAGTLPEGRPVGELLMHYDTKSQQFVPDANAAFLFITREGNMGVIETTDRVTRTANAHRNRHRPTARCQPIVRRRLRQGSSIQSDGDYSLRCESGPLLPKPFVRFDGWHATGKSA